jgi:hypothetical protein
MESFQSDLNKRTWRRDSIRAIVSVLPSAAHSSLISRGCPGVIRRAARLHPLPETAVATGPVVCDSHVRSATMWAVRPDPLPQPEGGPTSGLCAGWELSRAASLVAGHQYAVSAIDYRRSATQTLRHRNPLVVDRSSQRPDSQKSCRVPAASDHCIATLVSILGVGTGSLDVTVQQRE